MGSIYARLGVKYGIIGFMQGFGDVWEGFGGGFREGQGNYDIINI